MKRLITMLLLVTTICGSIGSVALASSTNVNSYDYSKLTYNGTDTVYTDAWLYKKYTHDHGVTNVTFHDTQYSTLFNMAKKEWTKCTSDTWVAGPQAPNSELMYYLNGEAVTGDKKMYFRLNSAETGSHRIAGNWSPDDSNYPAT